MKITAAIADQGTPFSITAKRNGSKAEIRIVGIIGWETSSAAFAAQIDTLVADGVKDAHIYLNTQGGSCFDAAEIVNQMRKFKGTITGEGGALVASAGTYIAVHCKTFEMPENGMFMIHKPSGVGSGNAQDVENYAKLLRDHENEYYNVYKALAKNPTEFEEKWNAGDYWLTANEALEAGFITSVSKKVKMDKTTASMIARCGHPMAQTIVAEQETQPSNTNQNNSNQMKLIALALGLKEDATEADITKAIAELKAAAESVGKLKDELKKINDNQINALVDAAVAANKFTADQKPHFVSLGATAGVDVLKTTLEAMQVAGKPSDMINPKTPGAAAGKKWEEMKEDELKALRENNPTAYAQVYEAHYGMKPQVS